MRQPSHARAGKVLAGSLALLLACALALVSSCDFGPWAEDQPGASLMEEASLRCTFLRPRDIRCEGTFDAEGGAIRAPIRTNAGEDAEALTTIAADHLALRAQDGRRVYAEIAEDPRIATGHDGAFTVAALVSLEGRPTGRAAFMSSWGMAGDHRSFELGMEWDGYPYFMISPGGRASGLGIVHTEEPLVERGTVLVAASFEPNKALSIYANGVLLGRNDKIVPAKAHLPEAPILVGSRMGCGTSYSFDGAIADVVMVDRVLSTQEHQSLAAHFGATTAAALEWTDPEPVVFDLDELSADLREWYEALDTEQWPGAYRWRATDERAQLYSSADVAWIRWIIGDLDELSAEERRDWAAYIQSFQNPEDGSYPPQRLHDRGHALAHVTVALNVLGASHRHRLAFTDALVEPGAVAPWLESLDWYWQWGGSCTLWGYGMTLLATPETPSYFEHDLFAWLDAEVDPTLGAWRRDREVRHLVDYIGGGFHIWTLYTSQSRPLPYGERILDLVLPLQHADGDFNRKFGCGVLDGVYALAVAGRETGYRGDDVELALRRSLHGLTDLHERETFMTGSHGTLSRVATLALLQEALPEELASQTPWRQPWTDPSLYRLSWEEP